MSNFKSLLASCCLIPLCVWGTNRAVAADALRPNIIFILADDLGYGDVGCFGQQTIQTPHLDQMAREGLRFTDFYAGSTVCAPSRCVLMTGLHTGHCFIRGNSKDNLRPEDVTVAKLLHQAGYTTALVGKWGLGHEGSTGVPTRQGFDSFFGVLDQTHAHNHYPSFLLRNETRVILRNVVPNEGPVGQGVASVKLDYANDLFTTEVLQFLDQPHEKPFFLYWAMTTPHANNEAGKEGMEVPDDGIYADRNWPSAEKHMAAMVSRLDRDVGMCLAKLKERGLDDSTLVLFSSDNGPHREGGHHPFFFDSNGRYRGTKRDLSDGGIRVPTIARWPGKIAPGRVTDFAGYFADLLPTFTELGGGEVPEGIDGISFVPTLLGQSEQPQHAALYWEFYEGGSARAIRMGHWKGICKPFSGPVQLYDLQSDPAEMTNVAADHPQVVAQIEAALQAAHSPSPNWKLPTTAARRKN